MTCTLDSVIVIKMGHGLEFFISTLLQGALRMDRYRFYRNRVFQPHEILET
jgi:hypothetical protein